MLVKEDGWPWPGLPPAPALAKPDASWSVQLSLLYNCEPKGGAVPILFIYGGRAQYTEACPGSTGPGPLLGLPHSWRQKPGLPLRERKSKQVMHRLASKGSAIFWISGGDEAEELPRAEPTPTQSEALTRSEKEDGPGRETTHIV